MSAQSDLKSVMHPSPDGIVAGALPTLIWAETRYAGCLHGRTPKRGTGLEAKDQGTPSCSASGPILAMTEQRLVHGSLAH